MSYFFSGIFIFLGLFKKRSKIITAFLIIIMWILFGWNTGNADYYNYNIAYNYFSNSPWVYNKELGFQLLCKISNFLGLEYGQFLILTSIIGLLLIRSTVKKYTKNTAFVLSLYFVFPFLLDAVQVRNFLSMSTIIYALRFLIDKRGFYRMKYILFVIVASTFHYAALFYLTFLLAEVRNTKKLTAYCIFISVIGVLSSYTGIIPKLVSGITSSAKVYGWFTDRMSLGIIIMIIIHMVALFLIHYAKSRIIKGERKIKIESKIKKHHYELINLDFIDFVYKINIISLLAFVFYTFNMSFFRLYRNIFIMNYLAFSIAIFDIKLEKEEKLLFSLLVFIFVSTMTGYYILVPHYESVFKAILENNSLFR
ncbi:MAG TPA: hypothetical protein DER56_07280 [Thermosipho africanus]|nr:hypothetical protein [Thermosipho africanus]